jgi:hypothetical protein
MKSTQQHIKRTGGREGMGIKECAGGGQWRARVQRTKTDGEDEKYIQQRGYKVQIPLEKCSVIIGN